MCFGLPSPPPALLDAYQRQKAAEANARAALAQMRAHRDKVTYEPGKATQPARANWVHLIGWLVGIALAVGYGLVWIMR